MHIPHGVRAATYLVFCIGRVCLNPLPVYSQNLPSLADSPDPLINEGWQSLLDLGFILEATLVLLLATVLAAVIAFHPKSHRSMESIEKAEAPKVYILYSVIGAMIGIMVLKYGLVVGFVVFGIGGLTRFRTSTGSVIKTGRMIFVTLIGLSAGLNLPHVAILSTVFGFALIYIMDSQITYRIVIKGLHTENLSDSAKLYRELLEQQKSKILSEKKDFIKSEVAFVFRTTNHLGRVDLEHLFEKGIPKGLKGAVDWEVG